MKRSRYNKFLKLDKEKTLAFNSLTCALAEIDNDFVNMLENIENINVDTLDEKSKELLNNMLEGNYIIQDATDELKFLKYRNYNGKFSNDSLGLVIAPTLACNFACPYCYESPKSGVIDKSTQDSIISMIEQAAKIKKPVSITWYGGEPLVAKDVIFSMSKRAIEICEKEGVSYGSYIVTNGYLITDEIIEKFKEYRITGAQITIDGPQRIHNQRRKLKNSNNDTFIVILNNIKKLIENGIDNIAVRINIDKTNVDYVEELLDILEENNLKQVHINLGHVNAYTEACSSIVSNCLNTEEYAESDVKYQKILFDRGFSVNSYPYYPSIKANYCCADNISAYVIDPEGYMYKCWNDVGNTENAVGNVNKINDKIDEKMYAKNIEYVLWSPFEHKECVECNLLPICMGGCPYKGIKSEKPECEKWIYSLEKTLISTYEQNGIKECKCENNCG